MEENRHERKRRLDAEALLVWARSLDSDLAKAGAISADNRRTAEAMIEAAAVEALLTHPRGGHRSTPRRELMPWEAAEEARRRELIEAAVRGRLTRRTGELKAPTGRLECLRVALREERISYGELIELQGLASFIEPGDVELLEAAGVPEYAS